MNKTLLFAVFIFTMNINYGQTVTELQKIISSNGNADDKMGCSVAIQGNIAVVGSSRDDEKATNAGAVFVYEFDGLNWTEKAKLMASDGAAQDRFGSHVAIDNNRIVVGADWDDNSKGVDAGAVYVFDLVGINWVEKAKLIASDGLANQYFGISVAIQGDQLIIGKYVDPNTIGAIYYFEFDGLNWSEIEKIVSSDGQNGDYFGYSVSLSNNLLIVGANRDDDVAPNAGSAYIFEFNGTNWVETFKLTASDGMDIDWFGYSVAIENNIAVVGAFASDDNGPESGSAYIFEFNGLSWTQTSKVYPSYSVAGDSFGRSVAISNSKILIGADCYGNSSSGYACLYKKNGLNWGEIYKFISTDGATGDYFGISVALDGENLIVGAESDDNSNGVNAGAAYTSRIKGLWGSIFQDFTSNCIQDPLETGLANRLAIINPGGFIVETNTHGIWYIDSLAIGNYSIQFDTSGRWNSTCSPTQNFNINQNDYLTVAPSFGMVSSSACNYPEVSIYMPTLRPCFTNQKIYVQACNNNLATGLFTNGYVDVKFDSLIQPTSSSLPFTIVSNGLYRFTLMNNNMFPGQCESFWVNVTLSCDAVLGQTICNQAYLFPADSCVFDTIPADLPIDFTPCNLPWDKSSISVDGWCQNDSIYFVITNTGDFGDGDMDCYSPIRLFIDGQYIWLDSIQLLGGETDTLVFVGDGRTWRLEVDQHPLHPGNSHPNATVELCGDINNWTSDLVNILPLDDADPVTDIYCGIVTASYDPNDKTGYPLGVTDSHYIYPNGKLDYLIRFQNTGTDTAFTVIIRDTLDTDLNIFSVNSGVASHNYTFRMYGPRVLEWRFGNILLPDSTTDEEGSHGFINFSVHQNPNLPDGTEINNTADIYFDFNAPIITNTTSHIIHRDINLPSWQQQISITDTSCFNYTFNNLTYSNSGEYFQINEDTLITLNLLVYPMTLNAGLDTTICFNESITLYASGAQNYTWDNAVTNGASFVPTTTQIYHVTGTDYNNCLGSDSIMVWVNDTIPSSNFNYLFNGFEITVLDSSSSDVNNWYWTIDGDSIGISNSAQYLFTQNGTYEICLVASNGCFSDTTCKQVTVTGIGINENTLNGNIKIYPNPTHSLFTIECTEVNNSPYEITDITGKIIRSGILQKSRTMIDLSNEANGFYLLRTSGQTIKLIKQ